MSTNAQRLAEAVLARRGELDLTQLDVWQSGGPSNTTLTKVEAGQLETLERVTARKLDAGLQWEPGTARRVWNGEAAPSVEPDTEAAALAEMAAAWRETQAELAEVKGRLERLERGETG